MRSAQKWHNRPQHERTDIHTEHTVMRDEIFGVFLCGMYRLRSGRCAARPRAGDHRKRGCGATHVGLPEDTRRLRRP